MQDYQSLLFFPALVSFAVTLLIAIPYDLIIDYAFKKYVHKYLLHQLSLEAGKNASKMEYTLNQE